MVSMGEIRVITDLRILITEYRDGDLLLTLGHYNDNNLQIPQELALSNQTISSNGNK